MSEMTAFITFMLESVSSFLLSEPVIYLVGCLILLVVVRILKLIMR